MALGRHRKKLVDCFLSVYCFFNVWMCICACGNWYLSDRSVTKVIPDTTINEDISDDVVAASTDPSTDQHIPYFVNRRIHTIPDTWCVVISHRFEFCCDYTAPLNLHCLHLPSRLSVMMSSLPEGIPLRRCGVHVW